MTRHHMDTNPKPLDAADIFADMVHINGVGNNPFPGPMTPGERHRLQEIDKIHTILSGVNVPVQDGNKILTVSERVQWLVDHGNV